MSSENSRMMAPLPCGKLSCCSLVD